jgi:hypothetical protein
MSIARMVSLAVLSLAVVVHAQELDRKQAGTLSRLSNQVTAAQTALDKYGPGKQPFNARLKEDFGRKLARFEEMLAPLPADQPEVKKEAEHLAAFKAALAAQSGELAKNEQAKEGELAAMIAALEGPDAETDRASLERLGEMFKSHERYDLTSFFFARWPTHEVIAELRGWAEAWPVTQKQFAELSAKYTPVVAYKGHLPGKTNIVHANFSIALNDAKRFYDDFRAAIEGFAKNAPGQVDKEGAALKAETDRAVSAQDYMAFIRPEGKIEQLRYRIVNLASVWQPFAPSVADGEKLVAHGKDLIEQSDAAAEKLAAVIIKENKGPQDKYAGPERAKLESHVRGIWAKRFPKESIIAVRFGAAAFERRVAWQYDSGLRAFVKSDNSTLPVWVIVKDGAKQAIMWFCTMHKEHLKGDTLGLTWIERPSKGPPPDRRLLVSNL